VVLKRAERKLFLVKLQNRVIARPTSLTTAAVALHLYQ